MTRRGFLAATAAVAAPAEPTWIWLDFSRAETAARWPSSEQPVSMGSLLKPFLVLAYGATHADFPVVRCAEHGFTQ